MPHTVIDIRRRMAQTLPHMTTRLAVFLLLLCPVLWAQPAAPRIAVIRVTDIYHGLQSTARLQQEVRQEREAILRDQRAVDLRRVLGELRDLETSIREQGRPQDEEAARQRAREFEIKRQEAQTLQREFENYRSGRETEINQRMVTSMRATLNAISDTARRVAQQQGYDVVLDSTGQTNTGVPFIVYQKNAPDLTDVVAAALREPAEKPVDQPVVQPSDPPSN